VKLKRNCTLELFKRYLESRGYKEATLERYLREVRDFFFYLEEKEVEDLREATGDNLKFTFRRCHDYIAGNQGLQKPEAFWELLKVIFCKIEDERSGKRRNRGYESYV